MVASMQLEERKVGVQEAKVAIDAQKAQMAAENAEKDRQLKGNIEAMKLASSHAAQAPANDPNAQPQVQQPDPLEVAALQIKAEQVRQQGMKMAMDAHNAHADRQSRQNIEVMKLSSSLAVHPESNPVVDEQLAQMSDYMSPTPGSSGAGMAAAAAPRRNGGPAAPSTAAAKPGMPTFSYRTPAPARQPMPRVNEGRAAGGGVAYKLDDSIKDALDIARQLTSGVG